MRSVSRLIRSKGGRRPALATVLVLLAATSQGAAPASAVTPAVVKPTQELAVLRRAQEAFSEPDRRSRPVALLQARRPLTGTPTALPVLGHRTRANGREWLRVRLPGRPNGRTGWIPRHATVHAATSWHVLVDTSSRRVSVYRSGRVVRVFTAIVGKPSTPTPRGGFFVEEVVRLPAGAAGAPFALALSARSYVLQEFAGGPGQIALHGLANIGGVIGTAVSHGCVRVDTQAIRWLAARIRPGVPVTIAS
jgi:lipoprotein-anchoring transpeptidase ErfK/SrfK